jgi:hypothetical protein
MAVAVVAILTLPLFAATGTTAASNTTRVLGLDAPLGTPAPVGTASTPAPTYKCPCAMLFSSSSPTVASTTDTSAVEVGVKFQSEVDGFIKAIRFYKGTANTGVHTGGLWQTDGHQLASATFSNETASGWQQVDFAIPVPISANTTYIASYHTTVGAYAFDADGFDDSLDAPPLHGLSNGDAGGNGVYAYGDAGTFPNQTYRAANYWVDVVFDTLATGSSMPVVHPASQPGRMLLENSGTRPATIAPRAFAKYGLVANGDGHTDTISLTSSAHDDATTKEVGFEVYSPSGVHSVSQPVHEPFHPWDTSRTTITLNESGTYIVQVFNYDFSEAFHYTLYASNPLLPPAPTPTPSTPGNATDFSGSERGQLLPQQVRYFKFAYAVSTNPTIIDLQLSPANSVNDELIGFSVIDPSGNNLGRSQPTNAPGTPFDHEQFTLQGLATGQYFIQLFNNSQGVTAIYTLTLYAFVLPTPVPTPAPMLLVSGMSGVIAPGDFQRYYLPSTGDGRTMVIKMVSSAHDEATTREVGFDVYAPTSGKRFTSAPSHDLGHPWDTATVTVPMTEQGNYIVQVYDYLGGETFTYQLFLQ